MTATIRTEPKPPVGVIDSLGTGFELVIAHLGLILFPLGLNLFLWFGPRLSITPLTNALVKLLTESAQGSLQADSAQAGLINLIHQVGEQLNVFGFLSTAPFGIPILPEGQPIMQSPIGPALVLPIDNGLVFVALALIFSIVGLLLGAAYFMMIGQVLDDGEQRVWLDVVRQTFINWARLTALCAILLAAIFILSFIFVVALSAFLLVQALLGSVWSGASVLGEWMAIIAQAILGMVILWTGIYLTFSLHGMVLKNRGVFSSIWDSIRLVQWNLYSVMGLIVLIVLINAGLGYLWSLPASDSWLRLAGIVGHAFVTTSLVAATFVFYKDRYRWWVEMRQWVKTQKPREAARKQ